MLSTEIKLDLDDLIDSDTESTFADSESEIVELENQFSVFIMRLGNIDIWALPNDRGYHEFHAIQNDAVGQNPLLSSLFESIASVAGSMEESDTSSSGFGLVVHLYDFSDSTDASYYTARLSN